MEVDPDREACERQWRVVQEWLSGGDARAAATAELRGAALVGLDVDDLLAETTVRVWRTLRARSAPVEEGDDGRGLVRYARRALRNAAIDALRASARRPEHPVPDPIDAAPLGAVPGPGLGGDGDGWLPAARAALHAEMAEHPHAAAAGLVAVAVLAEELALAPDVPQPERGATAAQAALWAGVWFVDGDDLFVEAADAAARQRRSRACTRAATVLARAVTAARGPDDG